MAAISAVRLYFPFMKRSCCGWLGKAKSGKRRAAMSTHIVPQVLQDLGFKFRFDFRSSLQDWAGREAQGELW